MPENVNVSALECADFEDLDDAAETVVDVDHVTMTFNMASEQLNNLKEYAIALARHELRFKEFRALDDVSIKVKKGDVFGILGTNGSGKSTLLKIIAGVLEPSKGTCTVKGSIAPLIELGAGFDYELTARENIYLNGALLGYSKAYIDEHFDEIVEFAEVEKFLDIPMKNYSSGMVARIAFAIATVIVPEILIVDEVLSVGDFMFQKKCEDRIMKLINEHHVTVLIVSHNNDQIERLCNKAVWIEKGHLRMEGTAKEVCDAYRVLGGRVGSQESEQVVFKALTSKAEPPKGCIESIEADSRYGLAARIMGRCYPKGSDTAILVSGEHVTDAFLVAGLSGALDAPVLLTQEDNLPDVTAQALVKLAPKEIIVVDSGHLAEPLAREFLAQAYEGELPEIEYISSESYPELSMMLLEYGHKHGLWGTDAVFSFVNCTGDLVSFSPYTVKAKCPIILKEPDGEDPAEVFDAVASFGFKRGIVFGGTQTHSDEFLAQLERRGVEAIRLIGCDHYDANEKIIEWIESHSETKGQMCELLLASIWTPEESCTAGILASKLGSYIVFDDPQDLDSIAHAIRFIHERPNIQKLVFLGDRSRYTQSDKKIIARGLIVG